ncbi:MAG: hypothetical protein V3W18_14410 [candidate division Zixibacteria bacterium]
MGNITHLENRGFIAAIIFSALLAGCGDDNKGEYSSLPVFERAVTSAIDSDTLQPARLKFFNDTLFVSYVGDSRIDLFTPDLERIKTIDLLDPEPVFPTTFDISDSSIFLTDHAKHIMAVYDRDGSFLDSFGTLPDGKTTLSPFALAYFGGVLYVSDIHLGKVLAVSMVNVSELTEIGELILTIPSDSARTIKFPSAIMITFDGRLLAGDAGTGEVNVFTCDGRYIYSFEDAETAKMMAPMGFAMDNIVDPSMQDSLSFDPSGIRKFGRYHVVDANNGAVHMYNPLGRYIASYPTDKSLVKPSDIAIDRKNGKIFIADPQSKQILIYRYKG